MKIDSGMKPVTLPAATEARSPRAQPAPAEEANRTGVSLSETASQLKELETQLAALPVVDRSRVDSIKAAIANGEYVIKPENIAAGLLDSVKDMLHATR